MMIRKLLTTTALASVIATAAFAQGTTTPTTETPAAATPAPASDTMAPASDTMAPAATGTADTAATTTAAAGAYVQTLGAGEYLASDLTGADVYQGNAADAASAGKIDNFLVGNDGKVVAAIIDTAGLDESKVVAVPIDQITWSMVDGSDDPRATLTASREDLIAAPAFVSTTAAEAAQNAPAADTAATTPATGGAMATDPAGATATAPAAGGAMATDQAAAPATTTAAQPVQSAQMGDGTYPATVGNDQFLSEDLIGENVYSGPGTDAESIGSVNDLVMAETGEIRAAVVGVGGFLGIGEKNVGVPFAEMQMTKNEDAEPRIILAATKDQLTSAPEFDDDANDEAATTADNSAATTGAGGTSTTPATGMAANTDATTAPAASGMAAGTAATTAATPSSDTAAATTTPSTDTTASTGGAADRSAMTPVSGPELTAETLMGTTVYGPNDENIGDVGDIALNAEGQVDAIIVDVGGFLGIGEKPVAVAMDNLQFMKDSGGSMYLYTQFTQEELNNAPEYNSSTYAENRDQMRIGAGGQVPNAGTAPAGEAAPAAGTPATTPDASTGTATTPAQ
jgi:ribosomal 30S subunit maturation factor RimM